MLRIPHRNDWFLPAASLFRGFQARLIAIFVAKESYEGPGDGGLTIVMMLPAHRLPPQAYDLATSHPFDPRCKCREKRHGLATLQ